MFNFQEPVPGPSGHRGRPRQRETFQLEMVQHTPLQGGSPATTTRYHLLLEMFHKEERRQHSLEIRLEETLRKLVARAESSEPPSPAIVAPEISSLEEELKECKRRRLQMEVESLRNLFFSLTLANITCF